MELKDKWIEQGFIDEPISEGTDLKYEIRRMCDEKQAVIMAHYYTHGEVQEVADFVGDSLALAQQAQKTDAKIIVMCGVHFMAETCKILSPEKTVICPDLNAGCSLADSCNADDLKRFREEHPDHEVISYVNTTAAVKAYTDVVVTSGNAKKIVDTYPKDAKLIFGPDKNLGSYINAVTGRKMVLWQGGCHVHERFTSTAIMTLKTTHPDALVLAHPECRQDVLALADVVGSTAVLLNYAVKNPENEYIVVTEAGILHEMQQKCPDTKFYPLPLNTDSDSCNVCEYMKLNNLQKIYNSLKYEWPTVDVEQSIAEKAIKPIERMLELS